jgi:hypothetical protein
MPVELKSQGLALGLALIDRLSGIVSGEGLLTFSGIASRSTRETIPST